MDPHVLLLGLFIGFNRPRMCPYYSDLGLSIGHHIDLPVSLPMVPPIGPRWAQNAGDLRTKCYIRSVVFNQF